MVNVIKFSIPTAEVMTIHTVRNRLTNAASCGGIEWTVDHEAGTSFFEVTYLWPSRWITYDPILTPLDLDEDCVVVEEVEEVVDEATTYEEDLIRAEEAMKRVEETIQQAENGAKK